MSEFDKFAGNYQESLRKGLALTRTSDEYQAEYKVDLLKRYAIDDAANVNILDFGCGVGLSVPYLLSRFAKSKVFVTDVSQVSLDVVRAKFAKVTIIDSVVNTAEKFDAIYMATVLHHITSAQRVEILENLRTKLKPQGCLFVVEHNTYNPVTQRIVSTCPMDINAELISMRNLKRLLTQDCGYQIRDTGYCSFFPQPLKALAKLDGVLKRVPLGGQYFVLATP